MSYVSQGLFANFACLYTAVPVRVIAKNILFLWVDFWLISGAILLVRPAHLGANANEKSPGALEILR